MKIAIIGYGKMGKTIEGIAKERGHEIVLIIDQHNIDDLANIDKADVAIEFTRPESALRNLTACFKAQVPVVCGTTGWLADYEAAKKTCNEEESALFYASNYSIGVNIFFSVNRYLAKLMSQQTQYKVAMEEIHHTQKLDAPSGTAITLVEGIIDEIQRATQWVNNKTEATDTVGIVSKRIEKVPGTHTVFYSSDIDEIEIKHTAHSRLGFATGAVLAAEWIADKKGCFQMQDMLGF